MIKVHVLIFLPIFNKKKLSSLNCVDFEDVNNSARAVASIATGSLHINSIIFHNYEIIVVMHKELGCLSCSFVETKRYSFFKKKY